MALRLPGACCADLDIANRQTLFAALPLHSAVRLRLTVRPNKNFTRLRLRCEAEPLTNLESECAGKAEPFRTGWRQSRVSQRTDDLPVLILSKGFEGFAAHVSL